MGTPKHEEEEEGRIGSGIEINDVYTAQMFHAKDEYTEDEIGMDKTARTLKRLEEEGERIELLTLMFSRPIGLSYR